MRELVAHLMLCLLNMLNSFYHRLSLHKHSLLLACASHVKHSELAIAAGATLTNLTTKAYVYVAMNVCKQEGCMRYTAHFIRLRFINVHGHSV